VLCARADKLFARLRAARLDNSVEAEMRRIATVDLLVLDLSRPRNYPDMSIGAVTGCAVRVRFWDLGASH
jgi:hypothetical protein